MHLESFRRDTHGRAPCYYFKVRKDDRYWDALRELKRLFKPLPFKAATAEFFVPAYSRSAAKLSIIFPEEWAIIQATWPSEITFGQDEQAGKENTRDEKMG